MKIERQFNRSSFHRPYLTKWFWGWRDWGLCLSWGDRNSDPVWSVGVSRTGRAPDVERYHEHAIGLARDTVNMSGVADIRKGPRP